MNIINGDFAATSCTSVDSFGTGVAGSRNFFSLGMVCIIATSESLFTGGSTSCRGSNGAFIPSVTKCGYNFGLGVGAVVTANKGHFAFAFTGRINSYGAVVPSVAKCGYNFGLGVSAIVTANKEHFAFAFTGRIDSYGTIVPSVAECLAVFKSIGSF